MWSCVHHSSIIGRELVTRPLADSSDVVVSCAKLAQAFANCRRGAGSGRSPWRLLARVAQLANDNVLRVWTMPDPSELRQQSPFAVAAPSGARQSPRLARLGAVLPFQQLYRAAHPLTNPRPHSWRVTEISQILLVLLDARCPLLHYPPALAAHLATAPIRTILVLTKVDIAGPARADAWARFLHARFPGVRVVQAEAYAHGEPEDAEAGKGKGTSAPRLPRAFRETLVSALRDAHAELLQPRGDVQDDPEREWEWNPRVRREVDWEQVLHVTDAQAGSVVSGAAAPRSHRDAPDEEAGTEGKREENDEDPEFLTIGLIGQPNVGKSSLLNALFGTHKVKASKTPGKTKHFQTLFWTPEVRLVDCPGLVMPNFVPRCVPR
ncbi:hypothetical protein POSPLADRAFT_1176061 [Postia placenta MAD-698-R-SB12]|uniref:Guanine nucleotide-binding protein-like 1 n=1 Tax=Postia placenta MAD-698-R-SB12 TaxID=670580 RepID=A0A1X6NF68_9APHY|nr:hypothetical protein POSPLADRAFT_1176061 [Postia placenta MAD-698-R-SB12]OSX67289.1 hypothetical protein POSPLADRAFT_1176061 [Postia placenta MAD-698-R-SB12]